MDTSEYDYLTMTPAYVPKQRLLKYNLDVDDKVHLTLSPQNIFSEHIASVQLNYQRFAMDFDQDNLE